MGLETGKKETNTIPKMAAVYQADGNTDKPWSAVDAEDYRILREYTEELKKINDRYLDAIFAMADDGWLMHGIEGPSEVQQQILKIAEEHPEYKRRVALNNPNPK